MNEPRTPASPTMEAARPIPPGAPEIDKTLADLEWARVLAAVADRCVGEAGRRLAHAMPLLPARELSPVLAESREACEALTVGEPVPVLGVRDVEGAIARLRIGAPLGPQELCDVASTLAAARGLRRYLSIRRQAMPALAAACGTDPTLDEVEDAVTGAFDPDGTLSDHASPRLRELRSEYQTARGRMVSRLEELMRRYESVLSDSFWTEREGRYVLPVRTDAHERFPGIVHATSASGSTLFVEPRALVPVGNRLKMLEGDVRREEDAIYAGLSARLSEHLASVVAAVEALARADVRGAVAKLARDLDLRFVTVDPEPVAELVGARHPLLALDGVDVVPSDVSVRAGSAVVVSGPNAGGKTVALKTLGLCALMLRAGMPVPCKEASRLGVFDEVLTDVGDDQSLARNLSTFSAHVKNLAAILAAAGKGTLVLLDEIATGTDPREGEALAAAVLDGLCLRGAAVVCTTHYEGLKALALGDARFQNASVGFDLATMTPTFRIAMGIPGSSSALAVAKRFGMPSQVLERATRFLSREERDFEKLVEQLHDERRALELARAAAEAAEQAASAREKELRETIQAVKEKREHELVRETEALSAAVRRAREDLRAAQAVLRARKHDERELREAARIVDEVAGKVAVGGELERTPDVGSAAAASDLVRGARVYVPRLRADAEILDVLPGGQLKVSAGSLKLTVATSDVRAPRTPSVTGDRDKRARPASGPEARAVAVQTSENTCDLRGLRADDAIRLAEQYLDRSVSEGRRVAFLVHGHGTGALRLAVRQALADSRYVAHVRPGEPAEGGDGVTVVWLR